MLIGFALSLTLAFRSLIIGNVRLDVHTLVYSSNAIIIGFQFLSFFLFSKTFAIRNGLLPESSNFSSLIRFYTLERGLITGFLILLLGLGLTVAAVTMWGNVSFGDLDPEKVLRLVIPGSTMIILGVQVILNSFFLSILNLNRK
jgi:hypothetical protein